MAGRNPPWIPEDQNLMIIPVDDDSSDSGHTAGNEPPFPVVPGNMDHDSALLFQTSNYDQPQRSWQQEPCSSSRLLPVLHAADTCTPEALSDELGWNQLLRPQPWSSSMLEPTASSTQVGRLSDDRYYNHALRVDAQENEKKINTQNCTQTLQSPLRCGVEEFVDDDKEYREKHSRDVKVHVEAERKRRNRIKKKMKELQQLVPNSNKLEQSALLEKTIEYVKALQFQIYAQATGTWPCAMAMVNPSLAPLMMQCNQMRSMALANSDQANRLPKPTTSCAESSVLRPPTLPYSLHGVPYLPLPAFQFPHVLASSQYTGTSATQPIQAFEPNSSLGSHRQCLPETSKV